MRRLTWRTIYTHTLLDCAKEQYCRKRSSAAFSTAAIEIRAERIGGEVLFPEARRTEMDLEGGGLRR